eukprot:4767008-Pyramimonas_sp.AAC.1
MMRRTVSAMCAYKPGNARNLLLINRPHLFTTTRGGEHSHRSDGRGVRTDGLGPRVEGTARGDSKALCLATMYNTHLAGFKILRMRNTASGATHLIS